MRNKYSLFYNLLSAPNTLNRCKEVEQMGLYKFFSCNVEVQYKGYLLSKAMLFTLITTLLTLLLPFFLAHRGRGFWMKSHSFYEQPLVHFNYEYLMVLETDDPSQPLVCGSTNVELSRNEEYCAEIQVHEEQCNETEKNCNVNLKAHIIIPVDKVITSIMMILGFDFQIDSVCPLHMQSLAIIDRDFPIAPSGLKHHADVCLYQTKHLSCHKNAIHTSYNRSLLDTAEKFNQNVVDSILEEYFRREVTTSLKTLYSRPQNGHTGTFDLDIHIRIPETKVRYTPSLLQELKYAWPQYLSFVVIFHWLFNRVKRFVFYNRLLMAWEVLPWKRRE